MTKLNTTNTVARVLTLTSIFCFALYCSATLAEKQQLWSIHEIRNNDENPCYSAFDNKNDIPAIICQRCAKFISKKAKPSDKGMLFRELFTKNCQPKIITHKEKNNTGWSLYTDQDFLAFDSWTDLNDDRNYTMGMGFSQSGKNYSKGVIANGRNWFDNFFSVYNPTPYYNEQIHSREYGLSAFTPNDLEEKNPILGDRPYSSLLYLSNSKIKAYHAGYAVKSKLVIAALGLDLAKAVQRYLHNQVGVSSQDPLGWDNQISEGGEPTALYSIEKIALWKEQRVGKNNGIDWDISYSSGFNIGYYTDIYAGFDIRLGRITSPYYSHTANPLSVVNHANCAVCRNDNHFFFASYRARAVAYNVLLQGQFRDSKVTIAGSDVERLLHEASVGWTYQFSPSWQLTYALSYKSKEYQGIEERTHWFGGLYLSKNFK